MASAQVLPNSVGSSRKQQQLEAGKRRLEEFRKKKAAAKKTIPTSQSHSNDSIASEKLASENGEAHINLDGATADRSSDAARTSGFPSHNDKSHGFASDVGSKSVSSAHINSQSHHLSFDLQQMEPKQEGNNAHIPGLKPKTGSIYSRQRDDQPCYVGFTEEGRYAGGIPSANATVYDNISNSKFYGADESLPNKDIISFESFQNATTPITNSTINDVDASFYVERHATNLLYESGFVDPTVDLPAFASEPGHGQRGDLELKNNLTSILKEKSNIDAVGKLSSYYNNWAAKPVSAGFDADTSGSISGPLYSAVTETHPRRSRTSFINFLNIGGDSRAADGSYSDKETSTASNFQSHNFVVSSTMQNSLTALAPVEPLPNSPSPPSVNYLGHGFREHKLFDSFESKLESSSQKQNEDFAALEQHIEDLTQEKFSLQRTLDTSKSLAESLAAENSSLTESYNQQASMVTQLKAEIERLQGEIKARLVELESINAQYKNVQLECNATDERAKLLASEVISLEEKALRLRSNELKLERELENSSAEIASYKEKLSGLQKERQYVLQTVDALQEEKKLLQSKLQRASAIGISADNNQGRAKKDVSTFTNDLGLDVGEADSDSSRQVSSDLQGHDDTDNLSVLTMHRAAGVEDSATTIPPDQVQLIQNINSLISEIKVEKEELVQALVAERSTCTKLKDLNKELSQKLEVQTQRLELLTAQSMASENIPARQPQPTVPCTAVETVAYADEGDEVVERVLRWIMKLIPGGPPKQKNSRLILNS